MSLCLALLPTLAPASHAETKTVRKLVYKEAPGYPMTLREAHIGGIVRLEIVISPKGTVDSVVPVGGNPVLVEAASAAVKRARFMALLPYVGECSVSWSARPCARHF